MGSDGEGGGSEAVVARKGRKRHLVLESSDSEADEYCILTRQKPDAAAIGNAGADGQGGGDQSVKKEVRVSSEKLVGAKSPGGDGSEKNKGDELNSSSAGASGRGGSYQAGKKVVPVCSEKLSRVKCAEGDSSEKNKGDKLNRSSSQPDSKRNKIKDVHVGGVGNSGSVSKDGTGGKMLRPGFPKWRFEKPEVRAGWVLDEKDGVEMKASSGSKVKEQVLSLDDKKRRVEPLKHEKHKPLKTDKGNSVDSGQREVIRVQGKSGFLKILPKNNEVVRETGDGKILLKKTKVDGETGDSKTLPKNAKVEETRDGKILTKRGVLKLLPKNNKMVSENSDGKLLPRSIKVDEETSDGKILMKTSKADRGSGDGKVLTKSCTVDLETGAGKIPARNNTVDGETSDGHRRDKDKSSALDESQKQDANGGKRVTGKLVSSIILRRSDPSVVGVSLGQTMKQKNSKAQLKISLGNHWPSLSLKDEKIKLGEHKNEKKRLLEHKGSPDNLSKKAKLKVTGLEGTSDSALERHAMKKQRGGPRNTMKQKLRDQIKHILLDNGWKIDLRRRKSKDYKDSVYVSPQGNGYWSITKAYAVFQDQFKNSHDEKSTGRSSKLNKLEPGVADASFDAISKDDLAMLQRNVRKRRSKKEHSAKKKCGDNRSRNLKDTFAGKSSRNKYQNNEKKVQTKHRGCALFVRGTTRNMEGMDDYIPYKWKRTVLSWMIDLGVVSEDAKVKYMNKKGTRATLDGRVTREGINCGCCSKILTVAKFELHAGSKEQQPYANIFLEDGGVSLLQCLFDAWDKQAQYEKKGFYKIDPADDPDDDTCGICGDGGDLLCCDRCTSTFHVACLGIEMPSGDWYCRSCVCKFCDSVEEKTSSFAELLSCLQCSRKYHQVCAPGIERETVSTTPDASIDCFCSPGCRKIYKRLKKLLGLKNDMEAGFSWSLVRCFADSEAAPPKKKAQLVHCNSKTALAFSVMDECFLPRIDERSGINIIHNVVYNCGSDFNRLNFSGFYTFILEQGDEVISAATVRIHGTDLAEMPFIGTSGMYRRRGMCHRLLNAIESALRSLNVRRLVIPAIPELQNTWTTVFGFKPVGPMKKQKIKSVNLLIIHGTGLLEKRLLLTGQVNQETTAGTVNAVECDKATAQTFGEASGSLTPVHASREFSVGGDLETKDHDNSCALIGSSAGLTSNLPRVSEEKTPERTSPFSVDNVNWRTVPGVGEDDMPCKAEADNTEEVKYAETVATSIADNIVAEQKPENKSNSSYAGSYAIPVPMDPCSCSSNELGKGENNPSGELSVEAVLVRDKAESNLNSNSISGHFDTQEDQKSCVVPANTKVPLVTMGDTQSSLEVKGLEVIVNGRSIDAYTTKYPPVGGVTSNAVATTEDHSHSAVDLVVPTERSVQQKDKLLRDKTGSPFPDLTRSSISKTSMLEKSNETKSSESDAIEMKDATGEVGIPVESSDEAGITLSALDTSSDICGDVTTKPTLNCGEGQLHGEDGVHNNSMKDGLASREPVNA